LFFTHAKHKKLQDHRRLNHYLKSHIEKKHHVPNLFFRILAGTLHPDNLFVAY